jgi:anti-sigma-K factor RskA
VKVRNDDLREALAAEYALGTLQGAARRRFERSLKEDPRLRHAVARWQERLAPLNEAVAPVQPPTWLWHRIRDRIQPTRHRASSLGRLWSSLGFWRFTGFASSAAAIALAAYLALAPTARQRELMVVVMSDEAARPALTVSWPMRARGGQLLRVRVIGHATMEPDTAWELWMLPGGDQKPVSLGLITTHETQTLIIPEQLARTINAAWGLAMSVEPKGGSPTGLPTGPVLYKGQCTRL